MKETVLPAIQEEVNQGKAYANLRQVYNSLILAEYYKQRYHSGQSLYSRLINRGYIEGLESNEPWASEDFYNAYVKSCQEGEYRLSQQEYDPYLASMVQKYYFYGGILITHKIAQILKVRATPTTSEQAETSEAEILSAKSSTKKILVKAFSRNSERPWNTELEIHQEVDMPMTLRADADPVSKQLFVKRIIQRRLNRDMSPAQTDTIIRELAGVDLNFNNVFEVYREKGYLRQAGFARVDRGNIDWEDEWNVLAEFNGQQKKKISIIERALCREGYRISIKEYQKSMVAPILDMTSEAELQEVLAEFTSDALVSSLFNIEHTQELMEKSPEIAFKLINFLIVKGTQELRKNIFTITDESFLNLDFMQTIIARDVFWGTSFLIELNAEYVDSLKAFLRNLDMQVFRQYAKIHPLKIFSAIKTLENKLDLCKQRVQKLEQSRAFGHEKILSLFRRHPYNFLVYLVHHDIREEQFQQFISFVEQYASNTNLQKLLEDNWIQSRDADLYETIVGLQRWAPENFGQVLEFLSSSEESPQYLNALLSQDVKSIDGAVESLAERARHYLESEAYTLDARKLLERSIHQYRNLSNQFLRQILICTFIDMYTRLSWKLPAEHFSSIFLKIILMAEWDFSRSGAGSSFQFAPETYLDYEQIEFEGLLAHEIGHNYQHRYFPRLRADNTLNSLQVHEFVADIFACSYIQKRYDSKRVNAYLKSEMFTKPMSVAQEHALAKEHILSFAEGKTDIDWDGLLAQIKTKLDGLLQKELDFTQINADAFINSILQTGTGDGSSHHDDKFKRKGPTGHTGGYVNDLITEAAEALNVGNYKEAQALAERALGLFNIFDSLQNKPEELSAFLDEVNTTGTDESYFGDYERAQAEEILRQAQEAIEEEKPAGLTPAGVDFRSIEIKKEE